MSEPISVEEAIDRDGPHGLCAICENEVEDSEDWLVVCAHGTRYLIHSICHPDHEDNQQ